MKGFWIAYCSQTATDEVTMADKLLFKFGKFEIRQANGNWVFLTDSATMARLGATYVAQKDYPKWAKYKCKARKKTIEKQIARGFQIIQSLEEKYQMMEECEDEIEKISS